MSTDAFLGKIRNFIAKEKLINKGDSIVMGVSGGADSVALFKVLCELRKELDLKLYVVTVNHGLREEAALECDYVKSLCEAEGVSFTLVKEDVNALAAKLGVGTEEAGRRVRYGAFEEKVEEIEKGKASEVKIAVAHNMNDLGETMLFHLFRGTGPKGLASIQPKRGNIIRPLLCVQRSEIEEWLHSQGIQYFTDSSNLTDDYTRNKIRHNIVEYAVNNINEGSILHMAEASGDLRELNALADEITEAEFRKRLNDVEEKQNDEIKDCNNKEIIMDVTGFHDLNPFIQRSLIKKCIDSLVPGNRDITKKHLDSVISILGTTESKRLNLPYGIEVLAEGGTVSLALINGDLKGILPQKLQGESGEIIVSPDLSIKWEVFERKKDFEISKNVYVKCFDYDKITEGLVIRGPLEGDILTINSELKKKKLSDYLIDEKVPRSKREVVPVLADGSHVWWVIGKRISEYPKVTDDTKRILQIEVVIKQD